MKKKMKGSQDIVNFELITEIQNKYFYNLIIECLN